MTDNKQPPAKNKVSTDWLVSGVLTKIGDTFDKLTGRGWKPSSSLAASELIDRLRSLLDAEVKDVEGKGKFVPHNIKLKMQWDKFSTDSADAGIKKLQNELLAAAIDHINDNRYHTYAPLKVEIKSDYFTEGVKLLASFDEFGTDEREMALNVSVPQMKVNELIPPTPEPEPETDNYIAEFTAGGKQKTVELKFTKGKRQTVGRTAENNLSIDDASVSKHHATLMINPTGKFLVADTGSTNGTFINGERIAYGRAFAVSESDKVKFGNIDIFFRQVAKPAPFVVEEEEEEAETAVAETPTEMTEAVTRPRESSASKSPEIDADKTEAFNSDNYQTEMGNIGKEEPVKLVKKEEFVKREEPVRQIVKPLNVESPIPPRNLTEDYTDWQNEAATNEAATDDKGDDDTPAPTQQGIKLNFGDDR